MKRCYLSHPNTATPAVLEAAIAYLQAEGWEVVDPTSYGKDMARLKPWEWEYQAAFFLTTNPDHVVGKGQFGDVVNFTNSGTPMVHLGTGATVVATRKVQESRSWKTFAVLVLAPPGWTACSACLGTGSAVGFVQGPCLFCKGTGLEESEPPDGAPVV